MSDRMTPALMLAAALLVATAGALWAIYVAVHQPWMGVNLEAADGRGLTVASTDATGPNGAIPPGRRILSLTSGPGGETIDLAPTDVIEEPDAFETYARLDGFFRRQGRLHAALSAGGVHIDVATLGERYPDAELNVRPRRAFVDLPLLFWVQLCVGVTGLAAGMWVWSLRRRDLAAFFFALAGAGLFVSALPAAVYSTRELALPERLFTFLSNANHAGALIFGAGMIGLFLNYPRRLVSPSVSFVPAIILAAWIGADIFRLFSGPPVTRHLPIVLALVAIAVCVGIQYRATRGDPRGRAALRWLGLSVLIGAGAFVLTVIVPEMFGAVATLSQGYAFLFFLVIYAGVALGVARYSLFDLEQWAFRILFTMAGVLLIVLLDVVLVFAVSVQEVPAFSLSFVTVALLYLPFRDALWRRFFTGKAQDRERLFAQIVDIALTPPGKSQDAGWRSLLGELFDPLDIQTGSAVAQVEIDADGLELTIPAVGRVPALRLVYAHRGRRLFNPRDAALANELISMLGYAIDSHQAYEKGVAEERARIARDMHDNIGAQLMSALHSQAPGRKDLLIRDSLSDLRDIINNSTLPGLPLDETLANLRAETAERLEGAGIDLDWSATGASDQILPPHGAHSLRSVIREAVSNAIRHSGAGHMRIAIAHHEGSMRVSIEDDGQGFDPETRASGNGLSNMRTHIEGLGGTIEIFRSTPGVLLRADFPLSNPMSLS